MNIRMLPLLLFAALTVGCSGAGPLTPSEPTAATWVLSGQSNAVRLAPYLTPYATIVGASKDSTAISAWAPDGSLWAQLESTLTSDVRALVWFQGESDADCGYENVNCPLYLSRLRDLVARIRVRVPDLLVVICGLADYRPDALSFGAVEAIRVQQQAFVAGDPHAVYVSTLDLPTDQGSQHLSAAGYVALAARIAALIR